MVPSQTTKGRELASERAVDRKTSATQIFTANKN